MIGDPASNLVLLQKSFGHAILSIRNTDSTGMPSSAFARIHLFYLMNRPNIR